jgi:hypothetical protein
MTRVLMEVSHSQYWICADDAVVDESVSVVIANGFADWRPRQVIVTVGAEFEVPIDVERLDGAPEGDPDDWQDVVEFSVHTDTGRLHLQPLFDGPRRPNLATAGPGDYRIRLSAKNRDPTDSTVKEAHRLQSWPGPHAEPTLVKLSSEFAARWGAPLPRREVDWARLAASPGTRLIVDWWNLAAPDDASATETTTVTVNDVLPGSPAQVFNKFDNTNPGYLAMGGGAVGSQQVADDVPAELPERRQSHIGDLNLLVNQIEVKRFSLLRFTWGFEEHLRRDDNLERVYGPLHPIGPGSTTVDIHFAKHPDGRFVTVHHHDVPSWLANDVGALWQLILSNRSSREWIPWPWSETW